MISSSWFHTNQVIMVWESLRGSGTDGSFVSVGSGVRGGTSGVLLKLPTSSLLRSVLRKIQISFDRLGVLLKDWLVSSCALLLQHSHVAPHAPPTTCPPPPPAAWPPGMALDLHSASHLGAHQGEAAGCQLPALSQYLITVQLRREKETFHLPITRPRYEGKGFHYICGSLVTLFRKAVTLRSYTAVLM